MRAKQTVICTISAFLVIMWIAVIPVSAELEPGFEWQVYEVDTSKWTAYPDYLKYSGTIYEVHFRDTTTGGPTSWDWEFSEDDWWGSTEQNPVHIYTEEEANNKDYNFKVKLIVNDDSANHEEVTNYVYVVEDPWNPYPIYELTPEPTATPTPLPTTAPPTTVPTTATPTPVPTPVPAFTLSVPVVSDELTKLKTAYDDHLEVILQIFRNIGILKE